jgi:hypothetical protein
MATHALSTSKPQLPTTSLLAAARRADVLLSASRDDIERTIDALIAHLDLLDGDPDLEGEPETMTDHLAFGPASPDDGEPTDEIWHPDLVDMQPFRGGTTLVRPRHA